MTPEWMPLYAWTWERSALSRYQDLHFRKSRMGLLGVITCGFPMESHVRRSVRGLRFATGGEGGAPVCSD